MESKPRTKSNGPCVAIPENFIAYPGQAMSIMIAIVGLYMGQLNNLSYLRALDRPAVTCLSLAEWRMDLTWGRHCGITRYHVYECLATTFHSLYNLLKSRWYLGFHNDL